MNLEQFKSIITEKNSEIFLQILCFLYEQMPFSAQNVETIKGKYNEIKEEDLETIATEYIGCLPINLGGTGETTLEDIQSTFGISNINTNISAINTNISTIDNKINELILVSSTQPQNSNTQIWFDTSNPIGG